LGDVPLGASRLDCKGYCALRGRSLYRTASAFEALAAHTTTL
jgi:hypothetical protein